MSPIRRSLSLDVIRGYAALSVLLTHWSGWTTEATGADAGALALRALARILALGWQGAGIHPGVVIFIVLSGFCIHLVAAAAPERSREPRFWASYFVRRALRIYPVYLAGLLLGLVAALVTRGPAPSTAGTLIAITGTAGLAQLAAIAGLSVPADILTGNTPLFTVTVEMLLYCVYPPLLLLARRSGLVPVLVLAGALYLLRIGLALTGMPHELLHGTILEFLLYWTLGAVGVEYVCRRRRAGLVSPRALWTASIACLLCYAGSVQLVQVRGAHFLSTLLLGIAVAVVLCAMVVEEDRHPDVGRAGSPLQRAGALGERSYSLYAVHAPLLYLTIDALAARTTPWTLRLASLALVLAVTEGCFRLVERPFHRWARRAGRAQEGEVVPVGGPATVIPVRARIT